MNKKLLLSFTLAAAMTGCINDSDVPSGNGDNPATGARGGNMEISFLVPNSSNGSRAASAEDSGVYEDGTAEEYKVSNVTLYLFDSSSKNLVTTINVAQSDLGAGTSSGESSKEGQTIVYPCNKEITVKPVSYTHLSSRLYRMGESLVVSMQEDITRQIPSNESVILLSLIHIL